MKRTLVICGVLVLVGAALLLLGRAARPAPVVAVVPFTTLVEGRQSAVERRVNYLITSPADLKQLWKVVQATGTPPAIDFASQSVIAVFSASESSSSIAVAKIEDSDKRLVSVALAEADAACTRKSSGSTPFEIVAVPATGLVLAHEDTVTTVGCPK